MRCLTIRQPYASLIAHGIKHWETRSWATNYRGPVAIHAAAQWEPGWRNVWVDLNRDGPELERYYLLTEQLGLEPVEDINDPCYWSAWDGGRLPTGAVVAVADLIDCVPIVSMYDNETEPPCVELCEESLWLFEVAAPNDPADISDQLPYGHWEPGNWAWQLDNIRHLPETIPAKGRQGLWHPHGHPLPHDPDGDLQTEIEKALGAAA